MNSSAGGMADSSKVRAENTHSDNNNSTSMWNMCSLSKLIVNLRKFSEFDVYCTQHVVFDVPTY